MLYGSISFYPALPYYRTGVTRRSLGLKAVYTLRESGSDYKGERLCD